MKNLVFALFVFSCAATGCIDDTDYAIPATDEGLLGAGPIRRYPWFTKHWQSKRSKWAREVVKDQGSIVFLGDSITHNWGKAMKGAFGKMKVANRGISGDTTRGMLIRLQEDVLSLNPSGVVILMGTNDLEEGAEPTVIANNFKQIIQALKKHNSEMPIVVSLVFPSSEIQKRPAAKIKEINQLYVAAVEGDPQITIIDTWTLFADNQGDAKQVEFPDLLHPNALGYKKWAKSLIPIFSTVGLSEPKIDNFELEGGYVSLFNGKDLSGWQGPATKPRKKLNAIPAVITEANSFDGKIENHHQCFLAKHGKLIVTTSPYGRHIQQIWTTKEFTKDFTLKLEFRAAPNAYSGVYIKGKQLPCRDFNLAGPYKHLKFYKPQEWNELIIKVTGTSAHCTCNGEVLETAYQIPASGPIGLEGHRGQVEYRRIRITEGAE